MCFRKLCMYLFMPLSVFLSAGMMAGSLAEVTASESRDVNYKSRDQYRHPLQTLAFFGVEPQMSVVEIWPGGKGWYTEILAPYLNPQGEFYAASFSTTSKVEYFRKNHEKFKQKLAANPTSYNKVKVVEFAPKEKSASVPAASTDIVLTFRNVHNWTKGGYDNLAFEQFYGMLKNGGILGVVEHRAKSGTSLQEMKSSGYMTQDYVIELAVKAGFVLLASSEINANVKDSGGHPHGVWSLPPSLRGGDENREKYLTIGESDRMTLKFQKPLLVK